MMYDGTEAMAQVSNIHSQPR